MVKYPERYEKISGNIVKRSFVDLKGRKIFYIERKFKYLGRALNFGFFNIIMINPILRTFSDKELKGFLAHELSHIKRHRDRSIIEKVSFICSYIFSKKVRKWEEREADKLAIKKGYGSELYASRKRVYKISKWHEKRVKSSYLSLKEIKWYTKKMKYGTSDT